MKLRRFSFLFISCLLFSSCAANYQSKDSSLQRGIALYGAENRGVSETPFGKDALGRNFAISYETKDLFLKDRDSRFLLLEPNTQTWAAYYYFYYLRNQIVENYPELNVKRKELPVVYNYRVQYYVGYFQTSGRDYFESWLERSGRYIPMMSKILIEKGLPPDLVYLAMIESGFKVTARSHMAAVGPWQFIEPTARRYGLRVDPWVDERMDPERSTIAAANYLADLYDMFQSWELAAAGYNCGEHRVQAAIDDYNLYDYWAISEYALPKETQDYVPKLMAALIIAKSPEKFGFRGIAYQEPLRFDKAYVPPQKNLNEIARVIGVSSYFLAELNPGLKHNATPPGGSYEINVPVGYSRVVASKQFELSTLTTVASIKYSSSNRGSLRYRVKKGDSLGRVAGRYNVSVNSLKKTNRIRGSNIRVGQVLTIPGRGGYSPTYASSGSSSSGNRSDIRYVVDGGDTLGSIAARHQVSVFSIKRANKLNSSIIMVGQVLSIPDAVTSKYLAKSKSPTNYRVNRGDTLSGIAGHHGVSVESIKSANSLSGSTIKAGQKITIPGSGNSKNYGSNGSTTVKHRVKTGETIGGIAGRYGVSVASIRQANNIIGSKIMVGQSLTIPVKGSGRSYASTKRTPVKYRVKSGDTLGSIAKQNGVSVASLKQANNIRGSNIQVGQALNIPGGMVASKKSSDNDGGTISHRVRRGDTLWAIASKYDVSVSDLKRWNNLKSSRLVAGKRLSINLD
ncbi:MAG: LysM peptidoglycan-binding domain-containing protein [Thermodesulfobacteriota bacterium]